MTVKIDLKDRRLLLELDFSARDSDSRIAKRVGLSKEAVRYRIKRLVSNGVIKYFHAIVDTTKLGLQTFRIFLKLQGITSIKERQFIQYLTRDRRVMWFVSSYGNWQYNILVICRDAADFMDFWHEFYQRFGIFFEDKWVSQMTRMVHFRRDYLLPGAERAEPLEWGGPSSNVKFDDVDLKILLLLSKDARASLTDMGSKLKLSYKTIGSRIEALEKSKVILGYRTTLALENIGYKYYKIHFQLQMVNKEKLKLFASFLSQNPNVFVFDEAVGGPDFEVEVETTGDDELLEMINGIKLKFPELIRGYEILRYVKEYKIDYLPDYIKPAVQKA